MKRLILAASLLALPAPWAAICPAHAATQTTTTVTQTTTSTPADKPADKTDAADKPHHAPAAHHPAKPHEATHEPATPEKDAKHPAHHDAKPAAKPAAKPVAKPDAKPEAKPAEPAEDPKKGSNTGLPLPRFAALKSDEVYMRVGPGTRYPIEWVYKRRDLPVEIIREFDVWRLVQDHDGIKGWVHQATLTGRRAFEVAGTAEQVMRSGPDETAPAAAKLKPGVIGRLRSCEAKAAWCKVQVGDYRGWLSRDAMWGLETDEAVQ